MKIVVIIPAFNEENAISKVITEIPGEIVSEIIVVNNRSTDNTAKIALQAGANVITENRRGYGYACLKGIGYLKEQEYDSQPDIIVFLDGDHSDFPQEMDKLVQPIMNDDFDMVIGSRAIGQRQRGAMLPQQLFGNWLAVSLMKLIYGATFTDLGPFRAIKFDKLISLKMQDKTFGWTVEMQLKAVKNGLKYCEVPVSYRKRIGHSKVTGTLKGTLMAGIKILWTIFKYV